MKARRTKTPEAAGMAVPDAPQLVAWVEEVFDRIERHLDGDFEPQAEMDRITDERSVPLLASGSTGAMTSLVHTDGTTAQPNLVQPTQLPLL